MNRFQLSPLTSTVEQLQARSNRISAEVFGIATNVGLEALAVHRAHLGAFRQLQELVHDTTNLISDRIQSLFPKKEHIDLSNLGELTKDRKYLELAAVQLPIPEGMNCPWLDYLATLQTATDIAVRIYDEVLYPFELFIGQAINNPELVNTSTFRHSVNSHDLTGIKKQLAAVRSGNRSQAPYSKVVRRNADWFEVQTTIDTLLKTQTKLPVELVQESVSRIDQSMTLLISKFADPNSQYRASPEVISQLAELCAMIAEEVSFYSATVALNAAAVTALEASRAVLTPKQA